MWFRFRFQVNSKVRFQLRFRFQPVFCWFHSDSDSNLKSLIPIPISIPGPKSLIPIPVPIPLCFDFLDSDSDSSIKWNHSGIDSDSGIGIVHHWSVCAFTSTEILMKADVGSYFVLLNEFNRLKKWPRNYNVLMINLYTEWVWQIKVSDSYPYSGVKLFNGIQHYIIASYMEMLHINRSLNHWSGIGKYCRVQARWGLRQTTLTPGSDKRRARDPLGPLTGGRNLTPTGETPTWLQSAIRTHNT